MSKIEPALTAEEWEQRYHDVGHGVGISDDGGAISIDLPGNRSLSFITPHRHAVAALVLYGQPFGFTHEDVKRLREESDGLEAWYPNEEGSLNWMRELADRIAALLPEKK